MEKENFSFYFSSNATIDNMKQAMKARFIIFGNKLALTEKSDKTTAKTISKSTSDKHNAKHSNSVYCLGLNSDSVTKNGHIHPSYNLKHSGDIDGAWRSHHCLLLSSEVYCLFQWQCKKCKMQAKIWRQHDTHVCFWISYQIRQYFQMRCK